MKPATLLTPLLAAAPLMTGGADRPVCLPRLGLLRVHPRRLVTADPVRPGPADGIEQTGQLAKVNGRTVDVIEVVTACEARDVAAGVTSNAPLWAFWR